jgi:hypothetical protein
MRIRRSATVVTVIVAIASLSACDDPVRPWDIGRTYVLRAARGQQLPAVLGAAGDGQLIVLADTLRLNRDGTGGEVWLLQYTGQYAAESGRLEVPILFEIRGDRLEGVYLCPVDKFCLPVAAPLRGEFTRDGLVLGVSRHGEGPFEFQRVD